jgi:hypothetical protein
MTLIRCETGTAAADRPQAAEKAVDVEQLAVAVKDLLQSDGLPLAAAWLVAETLRKMTPRARCLLIRALQNGTSP